jgi:hypothetical protein
MFFWLAAAAALPYCRAFRHYGYSHVQISRGCSARWCGALSFAARGVGEYRSVLDAPIPAAGEIAKVAPGFPWGRCC